MVNVLLDTNVILDYLSASRPQHNEAVDLLMGIFDTREVVPVVAAGSLKDAYHILCRKYRDEGLVRDRLRAFCGVVDLVGLTPEIVEDAFVSDEPDFEDGIIRASAESVQAVTIISRDVAAFRGSAVPRKESAEFQLELDRWE